MPSMKVLQAFGIVNENSRLRPSGREGPVPGINREEDPEENFSKQGKFLCKEGERTGKKLFSLAQMHSG